MVCPQAVAHKAPHVCLSIALGHQAPQWLTLPHSKVLPETLSPFAEPDWGPCPDPSRCLPHQQGAAPSTAFPPRLLHWAQVRSQVPCSRCTSNCAVMEVELAFAIFPFSMPRWCTVLMQACLSSSHHPTDQVLLGFLQHLTALLGRLEECGVDLQLDALQVRIDYPTSDMRLQPGPRVPHPVEHLCCLQLSQPFKPLLPLSVFNLFLHAMVLPSAS